MARYSNQSFITRGSLIDETFLDVNRLPRVPRSLYDEDFIITQEFDQRPDLLSYKLYETSRLWWVFAMRNLDTIKDPIRDFKAGTKIKLPASESIKDLYSR
tara:strand:+ start:154 stop:456 length:303 start_codon:yes stop_codon:yes gene_type:complete